MGFSEVQPRMPASAFPATVQHMAASEACPLLGVIASHPAAVPAGNAALSVSNAGTSGQVAIVVNSGDTSLGKVGVIAGAVVT